MSRHRSRNLLFAGAMLLSLGTTLGAPRLPMDARELTAFTTVAAGVVDHTASAPVRPAAPSQADKLTPAARKSIDRGTKWLISAMKPNGAVGGDIGKRPELGCTAIVGLTLLSQGNTRTSGRYRAELCRIVDTVLNMVENVQEDDELSRKHTLVQRKIGRNAEYFIAALFLGQILGEAADAEADVRHGLEKLVVIICNAQGKDGTWGTESWAPVLGTVLGWESLRVASSAGLSVDASATAAGEALLKTLKNHGRREEHWMHEFYKTASSIRVLYSMNYREEPAFKECVRRILQVAHHDDRPFIEAGGEEYIAFYLVVECMLQSPDDEWHSWYRLVRDKLIQRQNLDGSWSGHHCITDRTFCTAAALLSLQAANLYLPISNL